MLPSTFTYLNFNILSLPKSILYLGFIFLLSCLTLINVNTFLLLSTYSLYILLIVTKYAGAFTSFFRSVISFINFDNTVTVMLIISINLFNSSFEPDKLLIISSLVIILLIF